MQDGHPDSGESCDQDHHQLCGKLHTYLHFAHTSDIINKKRAIYNNTVWASNVFQAKKTLYTLSHNQAKETLYWGEYPLYFAACLGQEESYRLILARFLSLQTKLMPMMMLNVNMATFMMTTDKALLNFELQSLNKFLFVNRGADPDSLDTNGNNICHMMVILNKVRSILMSSAPFQTFDLDVSLQNHDDSVQCLSQAQFSQNDRTLDSGFWFWSQMNMFDMAFELGANFRIINVQVSHLISTFSPSDSSGMNKIFFMMWNLNVRAFRHWP